MEGAGSCTGPESAPWLDGAEGGFEKLRIAGSTKLCDEVGGGGAGAMF